MTGRAPNGVFAHSLPDAATDAWEPLAQHLARGGRARR
jgi:hypothetical protein